MSLHYNRANSYLFVNGKGIHKFKAKDWSADNMKKTGLNRYVYDFNVDYSDTAVDMLDIHNYSMKKNDIV